MFMQQLLSRVKANWKSGLTVSLVSIPLSVSLAVASQATPTMGIITAVWAGLAASIFGGSNYNITGPTGALSGIIAAYALTHGITLLPMLAICTGIMVLAAYLLRLEKYLVFVPGSAIHGFTLGVAFIIAFGQTNAALGLTGLPVHERFIENLAESFSHVADASIAAVAVFGIFLAGLYAFARFLPKLPGTIILAPIGIILGYFASAGVLPFTLITLGSKYADIGPTLFLRPTFSLDQSLLYASFTVAIVAILETMISAKIADGMTKTKHDKRKEMLGLGLANIASGFMGGIPATAALARTSLNVKTGANDKISATISSISIAAISFFLLAYFKFIPLAVIAAILVFTASRMVEREHFFRMYHLDKKEFALSLFVAFVTVWVDPIVGILLGTAIALVIFMEKLSRGQFELIVNDLSKRTMTKIVGEKISDLPASDTLVYSIKGQLAYINGQAHISRFESGLAPCKNVVLRLRELYFIDLDGVEVLNEIVENAKLQGKGVYITGVNPLIKAMLEESETFRKLEREGHVHERTTHVLSDLGYPLRG